MRGVYTLFFLSGSLGLVYEVLWLRKLLLVFGSTVHATSTILTVFFGGLALGSWLFGRLSDRRGAPGLLRWYAACEAVVGLYAFATPWLFRAVEQVYIPLYRASGLSPSVLVGASFLCTAAVLLIPTVLMGGTFPLVSRFLIRSAQERGLRIASLYAINTAGAMAGTVLVYTVGLQTLGWVLSLQCAGILSLLIGLLARTFSRALSASPAAGQGTTSGEDPRLVRVLLLAFGLSGFSAMLYEVAWTRALSLVVGSSIYAFCIMLATFLGGIAAGSAIARGWLRAAPLDSARDSPDLRSGSRARVEQVVILESVLAAYGLFSIALFGRLPEAFVRLWPLFDRSFAGLSWVQLILSISVMAVPTLAMGLLFPLVGELLTAPPDRVGRRLGTGYAVNTLGGILGSFLAGFWLIPHWGLAWTLVLGAMVNLAAALVLYVRISPVGLVRRLAFSAASLALYAGLGAAVFVPAWQRQMLVLGVFMSPQAYEGTSVLDAAQQHELLFYRDGLHTTVSVHRNAQDGHLFLKVGGKTDASSGGDMGTQVLLAHLPLLFHPHPSRVLVIGLGSGVTLGSAGRYPVSELHCAELEPAVIEGARFFAEHNHRIHDDPRARIYAADGRNFLLAADAPYDVIISEPSNPWMAGIANLYTREFFELCRRRLAAGGIMAQWIHLYRLFPSDVKLILKTFQAVFPQTVVWSTTTGDIVLLGSAQPLQVDYARLKAQLEQPAIRQDLERIALAHPRVLLESFRLGPEQVRLLTADVAGLHEDDWPWLEFSAPKALYLAPAFKTNYHGLGGLKTPIAVIAPGVGNEDKDAAFYAALGRAQRFRGELEAATTSFEQALALEPGAAAALELGKVYVERNLPLRAQEALRRALELDPTRLEAYYVLARLLLRQQQLDEALATYEQAAALKAPDGKQAEELGRAFGQAKRWPEALAYLQSAVAQQDRPSPQASLALAEAFRELGRYDEAEQVLVKARERAPEDTALLLALAQIQLLQHAYAEARPLFEQVLKQAPRSAAAYFGLGELAFEQGAWRDAARWLTIGLRYDPYHAKALEQLNTIHGQPQDG
ncbi:MAG: fused MFS/spermidine synthase [Candidatus Omnitrophica bacterium]|nr:fused MFS/spermidine synthase [Candidatus Omnitrophota bacterium]